MGIIEGKHKVDANDYLTIDGGELTVPQAPNASGKVKELCDSLEGKLRLATLQKNVGSGRLKN